MKYALRLQYIAVEVSARSKIHLLKISALADPPQEETLQRAGKVTMPARASAREQARSDGRVEAGG